MTKLAITGATGFIGRYVLPLVLDANGDVTVACRDVSSVPKEWANRARITQLDLADPGENIFERLGCPDVLLHLAWGDLHNYRSPHHFETELSRHYRFLKSMVRSGLKTAVVTGTCFEYGMQSGCLAETTICQPSTPYGLAKHMLHRQLQFLQGETPFNLIWTRLFYTFGEGQSPTSLWSQLKKAALAGETTFPMSGGEQLRDFLPVSELAGHLAQLALEPPRTGVINVCSGRPQSVRGLVESWIKTEGWSITPLLGCFPYTEYEPFAFWGARERLSSIVDQAKQ